MLLANFDNTAEQCEPQSKARFKTLGTRLLQNTMLYSPTRLRHRGFSSGWWLKLMINFVLTTFQTTLLTLDLARVVMLLSSCIVLHDFGVNSFGLNHMCKICHI